MRDGDLIWRAQRDEYGWVLPVPAVWWKRLPVIRLVRAVYLLVRVEIHYEVGCGMGLKRGYDEWVIYAIRRGWC